MRANTPHPKPPQSLNVSEITKNSAILKWAGGAGDVLLNNRIVGTASNEYKLTGLYGETEYTVQIINSLGESNIVKFTTAEIIYKEVTITLDFKNKSSGSNLNNKNSAYAPSLITMMLPDQAVDTVEFSDARYGQLAEMDSNLVVIGRSNPGQYAQALLQYDVIEAIKAYQSDYFRRRGANTLATEVVIAKEMIKKIVANIWGFGSGNSSGAVANHLLLRVYGESSWEKYTSINSETVRQMQSAIDPAFIDENGKCYVLSYTYASDGNIPSNINLDYANLEITLLVEED